MKRNLIMFVSEDEKELVPMLQRQFKHHLSDFGKGTKLTVTLENYVRKKTDPQMRYIHVIFQEIEKHTGMDREDLKIVLKDRYGIKEIMSDREGNELCDDNGELMYVTKSLRDYTKAEMTEFIDRVIRWAREFIDLVLPDPEDFKKHNIKW